MWLFGGNLVCGALGGMGAENLPLQEEMLSLAVITLLMGQGRVRLEGTIPDGTGWLSGGS